MAKSLASLLSQIERLQKEAAAMQSEVVNRIRSEISKYGLTSEQLFGSTPSRKSAKAAKAKATTAKAPKFADGMGNVWGGMGKRPDWLRQALAAGKSLEEFLVAKPTAPAAPKRATRKEAQDAGAGAAGKPKVAAKKRGVAKKMVFRKARAKKPTPTASAG